MAYDEGMAERVREVLAGARGITEKKMFGGLCFLHRGNMLVGVSQRGLLIRFRQDEHETVMKAKHVRAMDFTKKPMKGFAYVDPAGFTTKAALEKWIERCMSYVSTLPKKE